MTNTALLTAIAIVLVGILSIMLLEHQAHNSFDATVTSTNQAYGAPHHKGDDFASN